MLNSRSPLRSVIAWFVQFLLELAAVVAFAYGSMWFLLHEILLHQGAM
jgi:hypothetical protein